MAETKVFPRVTLIMPTWNESASVERTMDSVYAQTLRPDELIIGDGGSTDGTLEKLAKYVGKEIPLTIVNCTRRGIGAGRNEAIERAQYEIIACADFGTRLDPNWLRALVERFVADPSLDLVAGSSCPAQNPSEYAKVLAAVTHHSAGRVHDKSKPLPKIIIPSTNSVAFTRDIWARAGGIPEWLRSAEDKLFGRKVYLIGGKVSGTLDAVVEYHMRESIPKLFEQFILYSKGNVHSRQTSKNVRGLSVRYCALLGLFLAGLVWPLAFALATVGLAWHLYKSAYRPYLKAYGRIPSLTVAGLIPTALLTRNLGQIIGHAIGYWQWTTQAKYRQAYYAYMRTDAKPYLPSGKA